MFTDARFCLRLAEAYFREHGNLNIPKAYCTAEGVRLGQWLAVQRRKCRDGTLSQDKLSRLTSIGFIGGEGSNSGRLFLQN